jgi:predicted PurR-regulated permease PerM
MNSQFKRPFTFDRVVRIVIGMLIAVALFFLLSKLSGVLLPFFIAWLIAYLIYPLVKFFQYRCRLKNRIISIVLALLSVFGVLGTLLYFAIPPIVSEVSRTSGLLVDYITHLQKSDYLSTETRNYLITWLDKINIDELLNQENIKEAISSIMPRFWGFLSSSIEFIISFFVIFIVFLYTVFILADYENFSNDFQNLIPQKYRHLVRQIMGDLESGMNRYFRGQALVALISGVLLSIGFEIIDLPLGLLLGLIMGILTLIPYLKLIMVPPIAFFVMLKSIETGQPFWIPALSALIVLAIVQGLEDLFLIPKIMGRAMGMNPATILLSLSIWGALFGILGMIIALPMTTIILSYYKRFVIGNETSFHKSETDSLSEE